MKFGTNSGIFLPFSAFFGHFLWETRDISSFSENIREILIKFHQNFAEKWPNSLTKVGMKFHFISFHFISFRPKSLTVFCWNFEVLAVRRQRNLVELEKCFKKWAYSRYRSCRYRRERAPQSLRCFISLFQSYPYCPRGSRIETHFPRPTPCLSHACLRPAEKGQHERLSKLACQN